MVTCNKAKAPGQKLLSDTMPDSSRIGAARSWFRFIAYCVCAMIIATHLHYRLPTPKSQRGVVHKGVSEFSEHNAMETISYLSDTLGYRIVGTVEEAQTIDYLENLVRTYKKNAQGVVGAPQFDIWVQKESGSHRFDIMDKMVLKSYTNVTNIVVRLSCPVDASDQNGARSCEQNAILLNAHFDTTLGSPGATDDGSGTAVMLDIVRVLSQRDWSGYKNSVVFLFNGAEETLQDASHAFITMHDIKDTIRAVVNIDACGTSGREILFQANSREMIEAYKQAPHPHGTVMANDVFRTGLIISDTDFRQFVQYGNLTGIDMAIYKNSYLYHTHLDITKYLQPGAIQHLGENTLAIVNHLAKSTDLTDIKQTSEVVFFDVHGLFFMVYSWSTAYRIQMITVVVAVSFFAYIVKKTSQTSPYRSPGHIAVSYLKSVVSVVLSFVAALVAPTLVALFLTSETISRHMVWFSKEWYGALVFSPMGYIGAYGVQYLFHYLPGPQHVDLEYGTLISLMLTFALVTAMTTQTGVASSYIFWVYCFILLVACAVNEFVLKPGQIKSKVREPKVHAWTYAICTFPLALLYTDYAYALIDIFVPLTGRMGVQTPVDLIVAVIFGMISFMISLPSIAHIHRFGKKFLAKILLLLLVVQATVLGAVMLWGGSYGGWAFPYDELHPKRIFVQHLKNLTSGEITIGLAEADHGPYIQTIVHSLEKELGVPAQARNDPQNMNEWESVYPFNAFLGGYSFDAVPYIQSHGDKEIINNITHVVDALPGPFPNLVVQNDAYDHATGIRSFSVVCVAPTYTWTVITFDGHVVDWNIGDETPLEESSHYVLRHVAGYGSEGWKLDLSVKVPEEERAEAEAGRWKMRFEFTALEKEGFAGHRKERLVAGVGLLAAVDQILPIWATPTWLSTVVKIWEL
ncbi:hypothetical protein DFQ28_011149 [Apophysomyces sp. BC1034]|nr:hypothetical protein DFQ30_010890 [Apophysomyces sp. BC1015]KAG0173323.1 hypothetical protein DFQ29_007992 [Apophysomyces sp. BC1021]KAG0184428.1 hypothetical protein DFQ28_011149 [Apophysomyces sp. BC1034]